MNQRQRRGVSSYAEIGRMTEGKVARMTQEEIETDSENREDHYFRKEINMKLTQNVRISDEHWD